jgi:hypothetical protein
MTEPLTLYDVFMAMLLMGAVLFGGILGGGMAVIVAIKIFDLLDWIADAIERIRYRHERKQRDQCQ